MVGKTTVPALFLFQIGIHKFSGGKNFRPFHLNFCKVFISRNQNIYIFDHGCIEDRIIFLISDIEQLFIYLLWGVDKVKAHFCQ